LTPKEGPYIKEPRDSSGAIAANLLNEQSIQVQRCQPFFCAKMMELKDVPLKDFPEVADLSPTSLLLCCPCSKASMVFAYL
jgi:hypothetical protein